MISPQEARARVARGAAHLDLVRPGWEDRIDIGIFDLSSGGKCIVGQLVDWDAHGCGVFRDAIVFLELQPEQATEHGLDIEWFRHAEDDSDFVSTDFGPLQDAWIEAIADRRLQAEPSTSDAERVTCGESAVEVCR